ncbi:hypothetical protein ACFE04_018390 [Oxalis oulophora]
MAAGWTSNHEKLNDMMIAKSCVDFLQNCDLPPPHKVFSGLDKAVISPMNLVFSNTMKNQRENDVLHENIDHNEKLGLLKALRLSQTRAREAERKTEMLVKEKENISNAFLHESMRLSAYRQWTRLLEIQVSKLQPQQQKRKFDGSRNSNKEGVHNEDDGNGMALWTVALALCLGITGFGFAFTSGNLFQSYTPTTMANVAWSRLSANNNL